MSLTITGEVENETTLSFDELKALPDQVDDVSKEVEGRRGGGVRLKAIIDKTGRRDGADHATLASTDGAFTASVPIDDILDAIVVYRDGDGPLPEDLGGPIRFLIPNPAACHSGGASREAGLDVRNACVSRPSTCANVKFLGKIELTRGKVEDTRDSMEPNH